jgi:hypothetical protein
VRGNLVGLLIIAGAAYGGYWYGKKKCAGAGR